MEIKKRSFYLVSFLLPWTFRRQSKNVLLDNGGMLLNGFYASFSRTIDRAQLIAGTIDHR
jgi:hypothetical protein